jgi:hypothetical protein
MYSPLCADFTRLKLVKGKKEVELAKELKLKEEAKAAGKLPTGKENEEDITAQFDAQDDADVVF